MTYHFTTMDHFDRATSRMLDALIEGHFIHAALDTEPHDRMTLTGIRVRPHGLIRSKGSTAA